MATPLRVRYRSKASNVLEAFLPDVLRDELGRQVLLLQELRMDPHHQRLLVVAAIEDPDAPPLRQALHAPPEKIVVEVLAGGRLEREDLAALRIDARHDVLDGAVLARGVHRLKDQQDGPVVLGVQHVLQLGQRLDSGGKRFLRPRFVLRLQVERVAGVHVLEAEFVSLGHTERLRELARLRDERVDVHGRAPVWRNSLQCELNAFVSTRTVTFKQDPEKLVSCPGCSKRSRCKAVLSQFRTSNFRICQYVGLFQQPVNRRTRSPAPAP